MLYLNKRQLILQKGDKKPMEILAYILQGILALMFLMARFGKITGSKMHVEGFN